MNRDDFDAMRDEFDGRYVRQATCDERHRAVSNKFANDDKRIELLLQRLASYDKLLWIITTSVVGTLVTSVVSIILRG
nr:MAG TPA: hemolysin [Caudoviricetes sp.]